MCQFNIRLNDKRLNSLSREEKVCACGKGVVELFWMQAVCTNTVFNYLSESRADAEYIDVDTSVCIRVCARWLLQVQLQLHWALLETGLQSPHALTPAAQLMCHQREDIQCSPSPHMGCCVCHHHVQAAHPAPAVLPLWKRHHLFYELQLAHLGLEETQAHGRAVQQSCSASTLESLLGKGIHWRRGPGQDVLGFKMGNIERSLSLALESAFTPN